VSVHSVYACDYKGGACVAYLPRLSVCKSNCCHLVMERTDMIINLANLISLFLV
jgi:hypothetical protein